MTQNTALKDSLFKAKDTLLKLSSETLNQVVGCDSFPIAYLAYKFDSTQIFKISNRGFYPIYDLTVRLKDVDAYNSNNPYRLWMAMGVEKTDTIGNLPPQSELSVNLKFVLGNEERHFQLYYTTRSKFFVQRFYIRYKQKSMYIATKVEAIIKEGTKSLYEKIDSGFVLRPNETLNWNGQKPDNKTGKK